MKFKEMKFNVKGDPELSRRVQEMMFDLGLKWGHNGREVQHIVQPYLYNRGDIIYWSNGSYEFSNLLTGNEINIDWMRSQRETITIGDKSYYLDEIEVALANINPIGE